MEIKYNLQSRSCFHVSVDMKFQTSSQGPRVIDCYSPDNFTLVQCDQVYRKEEVKDKKLDKIFFAIQGSCYLISLPSYSTPNQVYTSTQQLLVSNRQTQFLTEMLTIKKKKRKKKDEKDAQHETPEKEDQQTDDTTPIFIYYLLLNFSNVLMGMGAVKINLFF